MNSEKSQLNQTINQHTHGINKSISLLERILKQTNCLTPSDATSALETSVDVGTVKLDKRIDSRNTQEIVDFIVNKESSVSDRSEKLDYLIENCSPDEVFMSGRLISFCGDLLYMYSSPSSPDTEELRMLIPLLKLLGKYDEKHAVLSQQPDFMYNLMRASVTCVTTFLSKSKELSKMTRKKILAGRVKSFRKGNSFKTLSRVLGIPDFIADDAQTETFQGGAIQIEDLLISLFDTSDFIEKDINKHIAEMQIPKFPDLSFDTEFSFDIVRDIYHGAVKEEEWRDVEIARVLPFGGIIAYAKKDWKQWLNLIDGELIECLRHYDDRKLDGHGVLQLEIGSPVGLWTADARFPGWKPLISTRCLRGFIIGRTPKNVIEEDVSWAVWLVDIGSLAFCSKVWPLQIHFNSYAPLTSFCSLDLGVRGSGRKEKEFLLAVLPLLTKVLANKPNVVRQMLAYNSGNHYAEEERILNKNSECEGGAFLMLIEYPDYAIRMEFLKLILFLARNSTEVLRYFLECRFYIAVSTRLEICVHFCEAASIDSSFWCEVRMLLRVLMAIIDECEKYTTELPGMYNIQKVLILLTNIEQYPCVKFMAARCNAMLVKYICDQPMTNQYTVENKARNKKAESSSNFRGTSLCDTYMKNLKQTESKLKKVYGNSSSEGNMKDIVLSSAVRPEPVLSVMDFKNSDDDDDDSDSSNLPSANAVLDASVKADFYTKGYKVNIKNSEMAELSLEKLPNQISEKTLIKCTCGFLNNGIGGTVYFGINSNSIIEGMKFTRQDRDTFRKGVDRMMTRGLNPIVRPTCYDINFIPVLKPGEKVISLSAHKDWVVEVHVKSLPHIVYTTASDRKCYVRQGTEFIEGMILTMRQNAAEQTRKEILKAIQEVKAQIPETKDKLVLFVRDYLKKIQSSEFNSAL